MSRKFSAVLLLLALGCQRADTGSTTPPTPTPPSYAWCRCGVGGSDLSPSIAIIRVVDDPVPYRAELSVSPEIFWESGLEFTVEIERMTVLGTNPNLVPPTRFRGRTPTRYPGGAPLTAPGIPTRGARAVGFISPAAYQRELPIQYWKVGLLAIHPATDTLVDAVYQFPAGTPVSQFLDRTEWGNPARGCDDCGGPSQPSEAGVPHDAITTDGGVTDATIADLGRD